MSELKTPLTYEQALAGELARYVTENKKKLIEQVLEKRTRHVTVVLEDTAKPHNASAVVRTCDCFGVQDIHMIENLREYSVNPNVTKGAAYWTSLHRWDSEGQKNTLACYKALKDQGYRIYATSPHKNGIPVQQVDVREKAAFVFGNELHGLSDEAMEHADAFITLPMHGFTESYNISVTAAICLHDVVCRLHQSGQDWAIRKKKKNALRLEWYRQLVKRP
ncbi:MAG: RNA methyltransferase, partial [Cytophagales bacterium]|nr:RNA methyltransferase [Cytophagales bacterium]